MPTGRDLVGIIASSGFLLWWKTSNTDNSAAILTSEETSISVYVVMHGQIDKTPVPPTTPFLFARLKFLILVWEVPKSSATAVDSSMMSLLVSIYQCDLSPALGTRIVLVLCPFGVLTMTDSHPPFSCCTY